MFIWCNGACIKPLSMKENCLSRWWGGDLCAVVPKLYIAMQIGDQRALNSPWPQTSDSLIVPKTVSVFKNVNASQEVAVA